MSCLRQPNAEPIPGYRLIEPLGSGGFGDVWKCEAPGGLFKAVKFVYGNLNSLDQDGMRAEQELHALERVKAVRHPFVLSLDRIEVVNGELVIVMELADKSLYDAFVESQSAGLVGIPRDSLLRYIRDAAEALDHMNERHNLQHLDIKPRNLFLISDRVTVADFGLVRHLERQTESGLPGGVTPLYAPPETFHGKLSDRSDQYSLAIVYQELLTGQRPFNGRNPRQLAQQHLQEEPELRPLPEAERPVVARALAKEPAKRFPNCLAFVRALYTAQGRVRVEEHPGDAARPKSLADSLEDIRLEDLAAEPPASVTATEEVDEVSRLGMTVAQPNSGALRPTLIIGLGSFGRRALRELRCRLLDRLGELNKAPLLRFLYVDSDEQGIRAAMNGVAEMAFARNEVHPLPLQPAGRYRRRMLDHLTEWLPREKLYSMPRSLQTQGCRAMGRLAFVDNHLRLLARVRREIQQAIHPDTLYQSVSQTGLALRESVPRIFVIAAAGGGSSGCLVDLGYALRRLLQQMRQPTVDVNLFLFCGAPTDPATPRTEQANVYATLTELNHFADSAIPFAAQYGADGPRLVDQGPAYSAAYLLQMPHRSPEALRDVVAHLGNYLFHDLTTPLGLRLDRLRGLQPESGVTSFRSLGTYAIWFPRGLLLRLAARPVCQQLLEDWMAAGEPTARAEVDAACVRALADSGLRPETLSTRIEEMARPNLGGTPAEVVTTLLARLEEQAQQTLAQEDPSNWAVQALTRVRELVGACRFQTVVQGSSVASGDWRKSRLNRTLTAAAEALSAEWDKVLAATAFELMQHPGRRLAAAEAALQRFVAFCEEGEAAQADRWELQARRTQQIELQLEEALHGCAAEGEGGWSLPALILFGNRSRRNLRIFLDNLTGLARQCLAEEAIAACQTFYACLKGKLDDRLRELTFCRQRLRHLHDSLDAPQEEADDLSTSAFGPTLTPFQSPVPSAESFWETIRQSGTIRVVLPNEDLDLEAAATRFAADIKRELLVQLDQELQDQVLASFGGLHAACRATGELVRALALPLLHHAATFLGAQLPITDVAQVELASAQSSGVTVAAQIKESLFRAKPLVPGEESRPQSYFLLVPASDAGKEIGREARQLAADLQVVRVPGQAHLMVCGEQSGLSAQDLHQVVLPCRAAYEDCATVPHASPHARFDITDWVPLDP
jgi:hypothetical protein